MEGADAGGPCGLWDGFRPHSTGQGEPLKGGVLCVHFHFRSWGNMCRGGRREGREGNKEAAALLQGDDETPEQDLGLNRDVV